MNYILSSEKFIFVKAVYKKSKYTDNRKGINMHYIARLTKGHAKIVSKDITVELSAGDIFYIPMNLSYESFWWGEDTVEWNSYGFTYFPESEYKHYKLQKIECEESLKDMVSSIPMTDNVDSEALGLFFTVLGKLLSLMKLDEKNNNEKVLRKATELINENPYLSVSQIAKECNVSISTLFLVFKRYYEKTPNTVKHEVLCKKAVLLLTTTDKSVQEISDLLSFSSTSYFRKILFAVTGKTPRQIRKEKIGI